MNKEYGQVLFEEWRKHFSGHYTPIEWKNMDIESREVWNAIAENFLDEYNSQFDPVE